ncbi:MAG: FHA domain-containing protein [Anaerolineales bacterium]|nr:FHA domain-containing protein [Anaerolineales bacterium]
MRIRIRTAFISLVGSALGALVGVLVWARRRRRPILEDDTIDMAPPPPSRNGRLPIPEIDIPIQDFSFQVVEAFLVGSGEYRLCQGENTIGQHTSNMVRLPEASPYHAVIEIDAERAEFMDWQPQAPSEINGQAVAVGERYPLADGDEIRIGLTTLQFIRR